jgi:hypothetical protein
MNLRSAKTYALAAVIGIGAAMLCLIAPIAAHAQSNSASSVAAEMTKGKLSPGDSKPGDIVVVKLRNDLKSNGELVLKKGTAITGVVRTVKRTEDLSAMEVEWLVPTVRGKAPQDLSIALQYVIQVNTSNKELQDENPDSDIESGSTDEASAAVARLPISGRLNTALTSMPSVVTVDDETTLAIESSLGASSFEKLFKVGRGQLLTLNGSPQLVDLFSHLSNDTVIVSPNKDFEISRGALMQLLVGVTRKLDQTRR